MQSEILGNKLPEYYRVTATVIKNLLDKSCNFIANLFNACLTKSIFLTQLEVPEIKMTCKPGEDGKSSPY